MKYTVIDGVPDEYAIAFPASVNHDNVGLVRHTVSAGFCTVSDHSVRAHGESVSLGITSRPEKDSALLTHMMFKAV